MRDRSEPTASTPGAPAAPASSPAVRRLRGLLAFGSPRILVALAGLPGAGKSTSARRWADAVNENAGAPIMQALGMDGFHLPRTTLARMPDPAAALARRGAPWTFDPAGLRQRLQALRRCGDAGMPVPVRWPDFQHTVGDPVEDVFTVPPTTRLVLVEGLYLLHEADDWGLRGLFDECWFLDVPPDQARRQLAGRHQQALGLTPSQAQTRIEASDALNAGLVWADRAHADWLAPAE